jgi:hypothetical protein
VPDLERKDPMKPYRRIPMEPEKIAKEIGAQARAVAKQREDYDAAHLEEKVARAFMLERVVDEVKPALRALCSRVAVSGVVTKSGEHTDPATFRALRLWGETLLQSQFGVGHDDAVAVYLTDHGDLTSASYHGDWHPGGVWKWEVEFALLTPGKAIELAGDVAPMLDAVARALEQEAKGAAVARTARLKEKAERIRAAALLMRSS